MRGQLHAWVMAIGVGVCLLLITLLLRRVWSRLRRRARVPVAGRWVVVTGCDSGFGRGVLEALVERGVNVIAFCFTAEGAAAALAAGAKLAPRVDLRDEQAVAAAVSDVQAACGGELWGLVHNAGVVRPGFVEYLPMTAYREVMEVNFFAPVSLTRQLLGCLKRGRVVLVSSVDGIVSLPGNAPYDASKFAIEAYADALRAELSLWGVEVSVVNPATMRTPLALSFFDGHRDAWQETLRLDPDGPWQRTWSQEWLDEYVASNTARLQQIAQDPSHAIGDIVHALTAKRPRHRYLSGTLAKTLFYALWIGPEVWANRFKQRMIQPRPPGADAVAGPRPIVVLGVPLLALTMIMGTVSWLTPKRDPATLQTTGVLHVNINVRDFERSRAFYEQLGFRVVMEVEPHGAPDVAAAVGLPPYVVRGALMAHADGSMIDLREWQEPHDSSPPYERLNHVGIARIALTTSDLDADIERLRSRGVEFLSEQPGEVRDGVGGTNRFICFEDPDGTVVELVEMGEVMGALQRLSKAGKPDYGQGYGQE